MDHFERSGLTFPVRDHGPAGADTIVLLHGFPQDVSSYDDVVPTLISAGFRVLLPTQRGYAASARPARRRDYRPRKLADDVIGLLDAAAVDRVHLVGHDWGGAVAWDVAGRYPERVRSATVLSTPHPRAFAESMLRGNQALRSWYMAFFQLPRLPELMLSSRLGKTLSDSGLPAEHVARYCAPMADRAALTGAVNWYRGMMLSGVTPEVTVPTSYLWGAKDFALGRVAAERTALHVRGDYTFEALNAGHWLPETRPEHVARAIIERARSAT
jgi:pimeloyl-ACP methyl ester carboxylesterase